MNKRPHAPPADGADGERPHQPEKAFFLSPEDSVDLPRHLGRLLDILLIFRRGAGQAVTIDPTTSQIAARYGCTNAHMRRLLGQLRAQYDGLTYEYPTRTHRVIRFVYKLKGDRGLGRETVDPSPRKAGCSAERDKPCIAPRYNRPNRDGGPKSTIDASGATGSDASGATSLLLREFEQRNTTLTERVLDLPEAPDPVVEPSPPAGPRPETQPERNARLATAWAALASDEQASIEAEVRKANPSSARFPSWIQRLNLAAIERADPALYPPIVERPKPPPPVAPKKWSTAEAFRMLTASTPPDQVNALIRAWSREFNDVWSTDFHRKIVHKVQAGILPAEDLALGYVWAATQPCPRKAFTLLTQRLEAIQ